MKPEIINIAVTNGLEAEIFKRDVLDINRVGKHVQMVTALEKADVVVFGPYGKNLPGPGRYLRVAYICENFYYDGEGCEYLFRVPLTCRTGEPSTRIQWHGFDPNELVKPEGIDIGAIYSQKEHFALFLYSNRVPYREMLFRILSKYKRVDAPGRSMNNHASIDSRCVAGADRFETKRRFQQKYKFTLAFENEIFPGYQTEKLYDAMRAYSIPVYIGDPNVTEIFDSRSFINVRELGDGYWLRQLEDFMQLRWAEVFGPHCQRLDTRIRRKLRRLARDAGHLRYARKICEAMVDRIVELDRNPEAYLKMLAQPWLRNNSVPSESYTRNAWLEIFEEAKRRR